nr:hypothetical protein CFP56_33620 [Quercus suber]
MWRMRMRKRSGGYVGTVRSVSRAHRMRAHVRDPHRKPDKSFSSKAMWTEFKLAISLLIAMAEHPRGTYESENYAVFQPFRQSEDADRTPNITRRILVHDVYTSAEPLSSLVGRQVPLEYLNQIAEQHSLQCKARFPKNFRWLSLESLLFRSVDPVMTTPKPLRVLLLYSLSASSATEAKPCHSA